MDDCEEDDRFDPQEEYVEENWKGYSEEQFKEFKILGARLEQEEVRFKLEAAPVLSCWNLVRVQQVPSTVLPLSATSRRAQHLVCFGALGPWFRRRSVLRCTLASARPSSRRYKLVGACVPVKRCPKVTAAAAHNSWAHYYNVLSTP